MASATLAAPARSSGTVGVGRTRRLGTLPAHWPITLCVGLYPLWWALGLGALIWPLFALPLGLRMLTRRRRIEVPIGFGAWLLYLAIVVLSFTSLDHTGGLPFAYLWRLANFASCTVFLLAICEADEDEIPTDWIVRLLAWLWIVTLIGGWLGVLMPYGGLPSLTERVLPGGIAGNEFVQELVRPEFAQVQEVLGYPLGRPKAPYIYTNDWGSAYALLLPFFFLAWLQAADIRRRSWGYLLLTASLVPVFISLNRGLWLSLGVALVYAASRSGELARMARKALFTLVTIGMLLIVFTPVGAVVSGRAEHDHSSAGRGLLYSEAFRVALERPLLGYGGPIPYEGNKIIPMVGTQGMFWTVLVSTGYLGLVVLLTAWLRWIWETRTGPPVTFWCHVVLIIGLVQIFVYDMVPVSLHVVFIAAALGFRAGREDAGVRPLSLGTRADGRRSGHVRRKPLPPRAPASPGSGWRARSAASGASARQRHLPARVLRAVP